MNLMKAKKRQEAEQKRQEANKQAASKELYKWLLMADAMMIYVLHTEFKFGKDRCRRAYTEMIKTHKEMCSKFSCNDYSHYWVIIKRLKDDGIDVEAIEKEVEDL